MAKTEVVLQVDSLLLEQARAASLPIEKIVDHALRIALAAIARGEDWRAAVDANPWRRMGPEAPHLSAQ